MKNYGEKNPQEGCKKVHHKVDENLNSYRQHRPRHNPYVFSNRTTNYIK